MAGHDRRDSRRVRWRTVPPPGDVKVWTEQHIISRIDLTSVRNVAHVQHLEGATERTKGFAHLL
jgi:hypothetical protein